MVEPRPIRAGIGLWWLLVRSRLRTQLAYPLAFTFDITASAVLPFLDFVLVLALFSHLPRLGGWALPQIALLYGMAGISLGIADLFCGQLEKVGTMVKDGSLDQILVRPVAPLIQVVASDISMRRVGRVVQALAVLIWAVVVAGVPWDLARVAMLLVSIVSGVVIFVAVFVIEGAFTMTVVDGGEALNALTYGGSYLASYPVNIFAAWLRDVVTFIVPVAFVSYYPAQYLLGLPAAAGQPVVLRYLSPLAALAIGAVAAVVWRAALRRYSSTGS